MCLLPYQESTWVLGILCQEAGTKTKYIFIILQYYRIMLSVILYYLSFYPNIYKINQFYFF